MRTNHERCFVIEGYLQNGGTYMAYQLGRICHENLKLQVIIAGTRRPWTPYFNYPYKFPAMSVAQMEREIEDQDLLICNPSFSSHLFGLRLPSKKLCYVQHVTTYQVLDTFFDQYVFVSNFVREFAAKYYGIDGPVINAFIHIDLFGGGLPWAKRKDSVMVLFHKEISQPLLEQVKLLYDKKYPSAPIVFDTYQRITQAELAKAMGTHKYYLSLTPMEGFGLPALEAMASGCAVIGFDAWGGRDYFRHNMNAAVTQYPRLETVADLLHEAIHEPEKTRQLAENARADAQIFNQQRFDSSWLPILEKLLS